MGLRVINDSAQKPVSVGEVMNYLRLDGYAEEDAEYQLVKAIIVSAINHLETFTGRSFYEKTYLLTMDSFEDRQIHLPMSPLISVESVKYLDEESQENEVGTEEYLVDRYSEPGRIALKSGFSWPESLQEIGAVKIEYKAGYDDVNKIPKPIKQAIMLLIAHMYEERQPVIVGTSIETLPYTIEALLWPYRVWGADTS